MPRVFVSAVIPAPAEKVWDLIRDFNGLPTWLPIVAESRILDGMAADQVGCTRDFTLQNGDRITETLVSLSDYDMAFSYTMGITPMPLENYFATLRLTPVTETGQTFAEWSAEFDCAPEEADGLIDSIGEGVFAAGFAALSRRFEG
ncbi:MAG: SRPBCC family protein [Paracoccaceae bacterium]|nr:SRPBCC family protein [Paracoccaceae bacterium]